MKYNTEEEMVSNTKYILDIIKAWNQFKSLRLAFYVFTKRNQVNFCLEDR